METVTHFSGNKPSQHARVGWSDATVLELTHSHGGTPKRMVFIWGKSQSKMDDDWGYPNDSGNPMKNVASAGA